MTALLAIERGNLDDMAIVSESALADMPPLASMLGLSEGEEMSLRDLVNAIMLMSGNDAANVIAEHIAGDIPSFVRLMNIRARQLGAHNTNFTNPTGLHDENHVSTVYDMALISQAAMSIPAFRRVVINAHMYLDETNLHPERRYIINTNAMVSRMRTVDYYFNPTIGIKTGFTTPAGICLAAAAGRGMPFELISVTFGATPRGNYNLSFIDTRALFEFGYENFHQTTVAEMGRTMTEIHVKYARGPNHLALAADAPLIVLIPQNASYEDIERQINIPEYLTAPVEQGDRIGEIVFLYNGNQIGRVDLLSNREVERHPFWFIFMAADFVWSFLWFRIVAYIVLGLLALYLIALMFGIRSAAKKARKQDKYKRRY